MTEKPTSLWKHFTAGGFSGVCAIVTGQPFDTVKVRLQTQPLPAPGQSPRYTGAIDCVLRTVRIDGFLGLYKGMSVPILISTPMFATFFFGFNLGKRLQQKNPGEILTKAQTFKAGMLSGVLGAIVLTPGDRIKCILQAQTASAEGMLYNGPMDLAKALYRQNGIMTFYRGWTAVLIRDVPGRGSYFLTYAMVRETLAPGGKESDLNPVQIVIAGGIAGVVGWFVSMPADVLKSRIQIAPEGKYPQGLRSAIMDIMRHEGPSAFSKGAAPLLLRAFPANAACFLGYEVAVSFLNWVAPNF